MLLSRANVSSVDYLECETRPFRPRRRRTAEQWVDILTSIL